MEAHKPHDGAGRPARGGNRNQEKATIYEDLVLMLAGAAAVEGQRHALSACAKIMLRGCGEKERVNEQCMVWGGRGASRMLSMCVDMQTMQKSSRIKKRA
jgi:hypothetical protein